MNKLPSKTFVSFFIVAFIFLFCYKPLMASRPLIGITGIKPANTEATGISDAFENQLINVTNSAGVFDIINPGLLKDQLVKFGCTEEECIISFAESAGISVILRGRIQAGQDVLNASFYAQGVDFPYFGKIIYKYSAEIPLKGLKLSINEYNLIAEEHTGFFIAGFLKEYKSRVNLIKNDNGIFVPDSPENLNGEYVLYRHRESPADKEPIWLAETIGKIIITENQISGREDMIKSGDFILSGYGEKAEFVEDLVYGRKREMVFSEAPGKDSGILFFSIMPASVLMPIVAPLSHFQNNDYTGMTLWVFNCIPYFYLEYPGLKNRFEVLIKTEDKVSRKNLASYRFAVYMLLTGGIPMVMDAFTYRIMPLAQSFQGRQPYLGSNLSAVVLSLVSGGGGHFYKGYRFQGYLYFHLNNILVYSILKNYSLAGWNDDTKKRTYAYLGAYGALKILEITHLLLIKDNIRNGIISAGKFSGRTEIIPSVNITENEINLGIKYGIKF